MSTPPPFEYMGCTQIMCFLIDLLSTCEYTHAVFIS